MIMVEGFEDVGLEGPSLFSFEICLPLLSKEAPEESLPSNLILGLKERVVSLCVMSGYGRVVVDKPICHRCDDGPAERRRNATVRAVFGDGCKQVRSESFAVWVVTTEKMIKCFVVV